MAHRISLLDPRVRLVAAARTVADVATRGLPAIRAAVHGARLGAGRAALTPAMLESLGVRVLPSSALAIGEAIGRRAGEAALVLRRGGSVVRAGARELVLHARDGLTLRVTPNGGAVVTASQEAVHSLARVTPRAALAAIGRATAQGAAAGALLDGAIAGVGAVRAVRRGEITRGAAVRQVGMHAARGAVAGGVGVAAAGAVSAGLAATGIAVVGAAPVAVPIVTMVAASAVAARVFDRVVGRKDAARIEVTPK